MDKGDIIKPYESAFSDRGVIVRQTLLRNLTKGCSNVCLNLKILNPDLFLHIEMWAALYLKIKNNYSRIGIIITNIIISNIVFIDDISDYHKDLIKSNYEKYFS